MGSAPAETVGSARSPPISSSGLADFGGRAFSFRGGTFGAGVPAGGSALALTGGGGGGTDTRACLGCPQELTNRIVSSTIKIIVVGTKGRRKPATCVLQDDF